jgi:hypothetical protein
MPPTPTATPAPASPPAPAPSPFEERALEALLDIVKNGGSPDAAQAQAIMLRRLALEGDIVSSRIPPPRNITEVGGYVNLLETLAQPTLEAQMLAGALGVAGPNPPPGWSMSGPPLSLVSIANDRPGPAAQSAPLSITVRSDFVGPLQNAIGQIHEYGGALPLWSSTGMLPPPTASADQADLLALLGRVLNVVPDAAFGDPITAPVVLARVTAAPPGVYQLTAHVDPSAPRAGQVPQQTWQALIWDQPTSSFKEFTLNNFRLLPIGSILATAGYSPPAEIHTPASRTDRAWARLANLSGLISGVTTLGSELELLYRPEDVNSSALAARGGWVWDGSEFAAP